MMQRHTILFNPRFSANTLDTAEVTSSTLQEVNGYQATNLQGLGGGITSPDNVRGFLKDEANERIINDFFSYLTGGTTTIEFAEIYNSDINLSNVFNNYYQSSVINNTIPSTSAINTSLVRTSGITVYDNSIHNMDGVAPFKAIDWTPLSINDSTRILNVYSALTTYTNEESYYIPVFIRRTYNQLERERVFFEETIQLIIEQGGGGNTGTGGGGDYGYGGNGNYDGEYGDTSTGGDGIIGETGTVPFTPPPGFFEPDTGGGKAPDTGTTEGESGTIDSGTLGPDTGTSGGASPGTGTSPGTSGTAPVSFKGK